MSSGTRWWARATAACVGLALALVVPAMAWAAEASPAIDLARRRPRLLGGIGVLSTLCCLVVVGLIVLGVVLIARRRPRR